MNCPVRFLPSLITFLVAATTSFAQDGHRFTGVESCSTSGCHGGGATHNQVQIHRKDQHANAATAMAQATWSTQLTQNLGITSAYTSARCTVCHSPLLTVGPDHFAPDLTAAKAGSGVSCESCHGPAEFWVRSHTRKDYTHAMRLQLGMRDTKNLYSRANVCVGCHQNIDPEIVANGHVPLTFELDDYDTRETAHWKDKGEWLGPRRWLTGQAIALREVSWMLSKVTPNPRATAGVKDLQDRFDALGWLLRKTSAGGSLGGGSDYASVQSASDRLARTAAAETWTKDSTKQLFRTLAGARSDFGKGNVKSSSVAAKRGYFLAIGLRRLYIALRDEGGLQSPNIEKSLDALFEFSKNETNFDGAGFSRMLEQIEVELAKG
ncbi:MAG: multiheme c-type cytochrome [Chthoniobacteraceae bacterium]